MTEIETELLEKITKIEHRLDSIADSLLHILLVFTTAAAQYLGMEHETEKQMILELGKHILDVYQTGREDVEK